MELIKGIELDGFIKETNGLKGNIKVVNGKYLMFEAEKRDVHGEYVIMKKIEQPIKNDYTVTLPKNDYYKCVSNISIDDKDVIVENRRLKDIVIDKYETLEEDLQFINNVEEFKSIDIVKIDDIIKTKKCIGDIKNVISPVLNCIMIKDHDLYSVDGYRLIRVKLEECVNDTYTIQDKFIKLFKKYKGQELKLQKIDKDKMIMNAGNLFIISNCYEDVMRINNLIPENDIKVEIDRKKVIDELKFLKKINKNNKERKTYVITNFNKGTLETEKAVSNIDVEIEGKIDFEIAYNMDYMLDALKDIPYDKCKIEINGVNGNEKPITIEYDNITELILPVRVNR